MTTNDLDKIKERVNNNITNCKESDEVIIGNTTHSGCMNTCVAGCTGYCFGCANTCAGNCTGYCSSSCSSCTGCVDGCTACTGNGGVSKSQSSTHYMEEMIKESKNNNPITFNESHATLINGKPINDDNKEGFLYKLLKKFKKQKIEDTWRTN